MEAILHIGTEKTGTTSFQKFCHYNRTDLMEKGVLYPANLGGENHRFIAMYGLDIENADEAMQARNIKTASDQDLFRAHVENTLEKQVTENSDQKVCLFSSEHLHSRLKDVTSVNRVKSLLDRFFEKVTVIIHLRPQIDVAISLASTQSRVGGTVREPFFNQMKTANTYFNYNILVRMWEETFGIDNVRCVPFKTHPDFLSWYGNEFKLNLPPTSKEYRVNEALDIRTMAMVNALVDSGTGARIDFRILDRLPVKEKLTLSREHAQALQRPFDIPNHALVDRRNDLKPGDLQPVWSKFPERGNLESLSEKVFFSDSFGALVSHYNDLIQEIKPGGGHA